ncbi:MAG: TauD/TfdA family dioxygenase [Congregibacter sp.]|nr:TauD/TfdA family dioxygenase [Congregibacter sp.]
MRITPFSSGCGVEVTDLQLANLSESKFAAVRSAFTEHGLLLFRDQQFSPEQHLRFAQRFGEIVVNKFFKPVSGYPEIAEVRKEKAQITNIGGGWHTDHSYDEVPAMGSILVARELPAKGGDTWFANLYAAYDALSLGLQNTLQSLRGIHSNRHLYGKEGYYSTTDLADQLIGTDSVGDATHPVVIVHPESGRKALYVNPGHTIGFDGWSIHESRALLDYLYAHVAQPRFTCRFNWLPGSVVLWDNRCTWHFAQNDYHGESRLMHRITLAGSALSGA